MHRIAVTLVGLLVAASFYLLLIDAIALPELYVLCGVTLLAAIAFEASREVGFPEARIKPGWLLHAVRIPLSVPGQALAVAREAVMQLVERKPARGRLRAVPFKADESSNSRGRIALAEMFGSFAPNGIVVGVDPETELMLVHQLAVKGGTRRARRAEDRMNEWEIAALVLTVALVPCVAVAVLASAAASLVAVELASTLATTALMTLSEGLHRQPFIDLAFVLMLVSVVGALAVARLMEVDI